MKKLFPEMPDVPQSVANGAVRIIERHFKTHRVTRAADLSDEAKVRLHRDLREFFDAEIGLPGPEGPGQSAGRKRRIGLFEKITTWLEDFLS